MVARGRLQQPSRRRQAVVVCALALLSTLALTALPGGWQAALVVAVLALPVVGFFAWAFQQQQHHGVTDQELKQVALCFAAGVFPTPILAMIAQSLLAPLWALVCFYDQRDSLNAQLQRLWDTASASEDAAASGSAASSASGSQAASPPHASRLADALLQLDVDKTVGYYVFLVACAFCVAALVEEWLKLWVVHGACCGRCCAKASSSARRGGPCHPSRLLFQHPRHSSHAFVVFMGVTAAALGFSVFENVGYVLGTASGSDRLAAAALRSCVSTPLHSICGGITGVRLAERLQTTPRRTVRAAAGGDKKLTAAADLAQWRTKLAVLAPSILVHGAFDLHVLLVASLVTEAMASAHPTAYGVVVPAVGIVGILVAAFVFLRRALHAMERQMNAGRYIQVAVDLESGRRVGFSDSDSDDDDNDAFGDGFGAQEASEAARGAPRKTRSVFNI